MDITTIVGIIFGIGMILLGQALEGGNIGQLIQVTAACIVLGGAIGATIVAFPMEELKNALLFTKDIFGEPKVNYKETIDEIIGFAVKARKDGVISLEKEARNASDPILRLGLEAVADGTDPTFVKNMMETQLGVFEAKVEGAAKVWETCGGIAPTIGIIGAVLGLIQVMQNLADPSKLGAGIAVAFVATIYGLLFANFFCIPFGTKIKVKYGKIIKLKELIIDGVIGIQAGESPAILERKLMTYILDSHLEEETAK